MSKVQANVSTGGTVGTTSAALVGANPGRIEITVVNDHATQVLYLQLATNQGVAPTAAANQGIRLNAAGGQWTSNNWKGAIAIIGSGVGTNYTVAEF